MIDFNYRFQKTWDRIPVAVKPTPGNAFLHYLKSLNHRISTTLQTMGFNNFPMAYNLSIRTKNMLIQCGQLATRPSMPLFPNIPNHQPSVAPIPTTSCNLPLVSVPSTSTSSNEMGKLDSMMQTMMLNMDKKL